ncbi:hypothetical protein ACH4MG_34755 [Streptomyces sp. NPDC017454]|uniref:hypothetical protein n=1 Tax=Streptomyces sp. NPDC017454 TaxID=3364997 RepID=UPI0037A97F22
MNGDLDEIARAELVEREPYPRCGAAPGSACRANSGVVAVDCHTGRYAKIPGLKSGPAIRIPAARGPCRPWQPGPEPDPACSPRGSAPGTGSATPGCPAKARTSPDRSAR